MSSEVPIPEEAIAAGREAFVRCPKGRSSTRAAIEAAAPLILAADYEKTAEYLAQQDGVPNDEWDHGFHYEPGRIGMTPSETLVAAADLIRDLATQANPGPWKWRDPGGRIKYALMADRQMVVPSAIPDVYPSAADARWIAALSPALAPMIEKWLRETAADVDAYGEYWIDAPGHVRNALAFAKTILGAGVGLTNLPLPAEEVPDV